jgi:replication factor C small subunit
MAICISQEILGDRWKDYTLELNASDERGIGMVRERVKKFSRFAGLDTEIPFKIIILDEADEMTSDAQTALRRIIEDTARFCRFILIANNISKIINPIQSRCVVFKFSQIDEKEITTHLKTVLKKENGKADEKGLKEIASYAGGDLRHAINLLQTVASTGDITQESVKATAGLTKTKDVEEVLKLAVSGNIQDSRNKMIELVKVYGMSESDFLKYINQALFSAKFDNLEELSQIIAKYDYRILVGSNPEIQLSAMLAELGKFSK